ncbi:MAG: GNAT family N-acetyltransferase [Bacteroidia bacterium]|nr:GNAT family N-acetyltransferase [Bacteroidia bacterium]NND09932.1 GNAT family N-acetyltransferase [Flavobacteriaceae bacterium]MBT8311173.1 GNAT family N-acetyltransferase [Bacteroidia bacterium]NNK29027.1 GNAT family N-acetyltransferase [Flavobacteriaceae bacterium]NNL61191.1 GNAT family N-acetyltransferase [Flavobacteriaceae bacterium]
MVIAQTRRLVISKMSLDDAPFYLELVNSPKWLKYIGDRGIKTLEDSKKRIKDSVLTSYDTNGYGAYKLLLKTENNQLIGSCGLYKREYLDYPDIGFAMLPEYEGKGYGYESSLELLRIAKDEFNINRIGAITLPTNQSSIGLLKKLGLVYEKTVIPFDDGEELFLFAKDL